MSNIGSGGVAKINCKFRDDGIVEVTLPIQGSIITTTKRIGNPQGKSTSFTFGYYDGERWFIKGSGHGRNAAAKTSITGFNGGSDIKLYHCLYQGWGGYGGDLDHLRWNSLSYMYRVYGYLTVKFDTGDHEGECSGIVISGDVPEVSDTKDMMTEKTMRVSIDWAKTLKPITDKESPGYLDPLQYRIMAYNGAVDPATWSKMDENKAKEEEQTAVDIAGTIERAYFGSAGDSPRTYLSSKNISGDYQVDSSANANITNNSPKIKGAVKEGDNCYYTLFHPYITLYLIKWDYVWWSDNNELAIGDEDDGVDVDNIDDASNADNTDNSSGSSGGHTITTTSKIHHTPIHYNDYKADIPVVYLSTSNYNNFVSAGSGVVSDSVAIASDKTFYIESIDLTLSGNTMTLIQVEKFDATLKLNIGEQIFGYILDDSGVLQPVFSGWVTSINRRMAENDREIVYTCRDYKFYFNQKYTPMLYQKEDGLKNIVNDLLIKAGITYFENNLPNITLTVKYQSESITNVLDWACSIAGDYWYWVDKNGKLHIDQIRGSLHSFNIPTVGDSIGNNKVLSFNGLNDLSNSRSRIVVTGGSGSKIYERSVITYYSPSRHYDSIQQAIDAGDSGEIGVFNSAGTSSSTRTYLADDGKFTPSGINTYSHAGDNYVWYKDSRGYYRTSQSWTSATYDHYYLIRKRNVKFFSQMLAEKRSAWSDQYIYDPWRGLIWLGEAGISIQNDTVKGDSVVYARRQHAKMVMHYAEKDLTQDLSVVINTGNPGGVYVYKNSAFRYVSGLHSIIDDTPIMNIIAGNLANYFKPIYGGSLELIGLRTELNLGELISLTNTSLPSNESSNLKIFEIHYDLTTQTTSVMLSTKVSSNMASIDPEIIKTNADYYRQRLSDNNNYIIRENVQY